MRVSDEHMPSGSDGTAHVSVTPSSITIRSAVGAATRCHKLRRGLGRAGVQLSDGSWENVRVARAGSARASSGGSAMSSTRGAEKPRRSSSWRQE